MDAQIKRIISEVAQGSAEWANRHKRVIGGVGAAGAAGAFGTDPAIEMARKGLGLGKRVIGVGSAVDKAEGREEAKPVVIYPSDHIDNIRNRP